MEYERNNNVRVLKAVIPYHYSCPIDANSVPPPPPPPHHSKQSLKDVPMVDALRYFLESFRLPGESPVVERILEIFSQHWLVSRVSRGGSILTVDRGGWW